METEHSGHLKFKHALQMPDSVEIGVGLQKSDSTLLMKDIVEFSAGADEIVLMRYPAQRAGYMRRLNEPADSYNMKSTIHPLS
jgi:hypothetical protein